MGAKNTGVGCHFLLQGNLPDPVIEPTSLMSPALAGGFFTTSATWEAPKMWYIYTIEFYSVIKKEQLLKSQST